jgi:DeoR family fructose operon transcriptional repressor
MAGWMSHANIKRKVVTINKELVPERMERLKEILRQENIVRVQELCDKLKVSSATIRRYLNTLENSGDLKRVHGGAVRITNRVEEPLFIQKAAMAVAEKQRIARAALECIKKNETIYLDGGSTILELSLHGSNCCDATPRHYYHRSR